MFGLVLSSGRGSYNVSPTVQVELEDLDPEEENRRRRMSVSDLHTHALLYVLYFLDTISLKQGMQKVLHVHVPLCNDNPS